MSFGTAQLIYCLGLLWAPPPAPPPLEKAAAAAPAAAAAAAGQDGGDGNASPSAGTGEVNARAEDFNAYRRKSHESSGSGGAGAALGDAAPAADAGVADAAALGGAISPPLDDDDEWEPYELFLHIDGAPKRGAAGTEAGRGGGSAAETSPSSTSCLRPSPLLLGLPGLPAGGAFLEGWDTEGPPEEILDPLDTWNEAAADWNAGADGPLTAGSLGNGGNCFFSFAQRSASQRSASPAPSLPSSLGPGPSPAQSLPRSALREMRRPHTEELGAVGGAAGAGGSGSGGGAGGRMSLVAIGGGDDGARERLRADAPLTRGGVAAARSQDDSFGDDGAVAALTPDDIGFDLLDGAAEAPATPRGSGHSTPCERHRISYSGADNAVPDGGDGGDSPGEASEQSEGPPSAAADATAERGADPYLVDSSDEADDESEAAGAHSRGGLWGASPAPVELDSASWRSQTWSAGVEILRSPAFPAACGAPLRGRLVGLLRISSGAPKHLLLPFCLFTYAQSPMLDVTAAVHLIPRAQGRRTTLRSSTAGKSTFQHSMLLP